jgi:hypothetical protein
MKNLPEEDYEGPEKRAKTLPLSIGAKVMQFFSKRRLVLQVLATVLCVLDTLEMAELTLLGFMPESSILRITSGPVKALTIILRSFLNRLKSMTVRASYQLGKHVRKGDVRPSLHR